MHDDRLATAMVERMRAGGEIEAADGSIVFHGTAGLPAADQLGPVRPLAVEQSNVSIAFGDTVLLKFYRRLRVGVQPEIEVARFLTERGRLPQHAGLPRHRRTPFERW